MTSLDIAEITGKNHFDVLKAIRKMEPAWEKVTASKFACSEYEDKSGKKNPMYVLTKTETLFIATKFNDEARAKLVLRWEQLETERLQQQQAPSPFGEGRGGAPSGAPSLTRKQILLMALEAEQKAERLQEEVDDVKADYNALLIQVCDRDRQLGEVQEQNQQLREQTQFLQYVDASTDTLNTTQVASGYGMSAVAFNNLLKGLRIQYNSGGQWVLYADYVGKGYTANRQVEICHSNHRRTYKQVTVWTRPGVHFLYDKLKKNGILPLIERQQQAVTTITAAQKGGQL